MSIISSGALIDAFIPVQRAAHESVRAHQVQVQKNNHHAEDVDELDDTAVNSVHDQKQHQDGESEEEPEERPEGERVEIEALSTPPGEADLEPPPPPGDTHLDISA